MYYITLIFIIFISSFNNICVSEKVYKCKNEDINREIEIGDEVTLCLHSRELGKKIAYKLKVDKYSIITIKGGYPQLIPPNESDEESNGSPGVSGNYKFRNMRKEGYDGEKLENQPQNIGDNGEIVDNSDDKSDISDTIDMNNDITDEDSEEEIFDNPYDKAKVLAQIGDKMTKYPSVIYIFFICILIFFII